MHRRLGALVCLLHVADCEGARHIGTARSAAFSRQASASDRNRFQSCVTPVVMVRCFREYLGEVDGIARVIGNPECHNMRVVTGRLDGVIQGAPQWRRTSTSPAARSPGAGQSTSRSANCRGSDKFVSPHHSASALLRGAFIGPIPAGLISIGPTPS